jgi:multidrug resistance efflux pump
LVVGIANKNNLTKARAKLDEAKAAIKRSASASDPVCVQLIKDLDNAATDLKNYDQGGSMSMESASQAHSVQRSNAVVANPDARSGYSNAVRQNLSSNYAAFSNSNGMLF